MSTGSILLAAPELQAPRLFTPAPKAAKRVLEFFAACIKDDNAETINLMPWIVSR